MDCTVLLCLFYFFKQKTAYDMRISDWSSDVCSSDLRRVESELHLQRDRGRRRRRGLGRHGRARAQRARLHALDPFGRLGLELLDDLIDRRLPVAEIGALRECAAGREQCECRAAEQDGSGFHDDGLHDDLRWAGGSAIRTDWKTEKKDRKSVV